MRKLLLLGFACIPFILNAQLTADNFDSYNLGSFDNQWNPSEWVGWFGAASNATISDDFANSGSNSMQIETNDDIVALLGVLDVGVSMISFMQYIPTGNGAYFNLQHNYTNSAGDWAMEVFFSDQLASSGRLLAGGAEEVFDIVHDTWVENRIEADFNNMIASYFYNGTLIFSWALNTVPDGSPGLNQINGINFFGACFDTGGGCSSLAYYDDVSAVNNPVSIAQATGFVDALSIFPNPTSGQFAFDIALAESKNLSVDIYNAQGQLVSTRLIGNTQGGEFEMDLSAMSPGLYFAKFLIGEQVLTQQIVIQR